MDDKYRKLIRTVLGISFAIILISGIFLELYTKDQGVIAKGIKVINIDIGNLTREEATAKILPEVSALLKLPLTLQVGKNTVLLPLDQIGLTIAAEATIEQAYKLGKDGNLIQKAIAKTQAAFGGINLIPNNKWDEHKLTNILKENLSSYEQAAIDAAYLISKDNQISIQPEKKGRALDWEGLIAQIKVLNVLALDPLTIAFKEVFPTNSTVQLEKYKLTGLLARYSTTYNSSQVNRVNNIRLAAQRLNGKLVKPGETFSFNETVGPRNSVAGYKEAPVIINKKMSTDLGGGVCQVSSTLYNVLLLADLPIIERTNHDLAVTYVPRGRDATVDYGNLDLKFQNDTERYLLIKCTAEHNSINFSLYGQVNVEKEVLISTSTDHSNVVETWRTVMINGKLDKREQISSSHYLN
ncbi:MAG: VanW family protein [Desulfitobacteriaceae bacterium]|nr:VanW family protein [Desulfitobacteriaceae bacterium]MDD4345395.1 VanW family protein [Desulfitobacteriaceae bacterium]MDD4401492.1 VanW family protein [Desulfitobacteriaceae bacterium]